MIQLKRSTKRLIRQQISTNPTLQRQKKKKKKATNWKKEQERERERERENYCAWIPMRKSINLNGNDNSIRCCNWGWRKSHHHRHHHQKMKRKSNRRRSRRNQEGGDRGRSRGIEQGDPVAAKGNSRLDPIADRCSASLGCKLCIAMRLPIREPLTAPSNCWKPFLALFCSVFFLSVFLACFALFPLCFFCVWNTSKGRATNAPFLTLFIFLSLNYGLVSDLVCLFNWSWCFKNVKSLYFCLIAFWLNESMSLSIYFYIRK